MAAQRRLRERGQKHRQRQAGKTEGAEAQLTLSCRLGHRRVEDVGDCFDVAGAMEHVSRRCAIGREVEGHPAHRVAAAYEVVGADVLQDVLQLLRRARR